MNYDENILQIPIEDVVPNRFQPRIAFDDNALNELAASIKEHGVIQPLVLRRIGDKYEIVAGERRYRASKIAGLTSVPAVISNLSDDESAQVAIVENVQRKNLTAIEEAKSYKALLDQGYMTQEMLARKMGLSQSAIANKLRLLNLSEEAQKAVIDGKISERHARSLLAIKDKDSQVKMLSRIINERLTVKMLDEIINKEYMTSNEIKDINIEEIVNNAVDIPVEKEEQSENFEMPISLSSSSDEAVSKDLENEKASLNTFEKENPFAAFIEEIETLDFTPQTQNRLNIAQDKMDSLIDDLKNLNFEVEKEVLKDNNKVTYTIKIQDRD